MSIKKAVAAKASELAGLSFEVAMKRLESIVAEMEGGKLNLEDMIARFEEGQALIALCSTKLNEVEKRVEVLVKKGSALTVEPFPSDGDATGDSESDRPVGEKPVEDELF